VAIDLCVDITAPVRWRNASDPRLHRRDRKGQGDSRLRAFNVDAYSFNKFLPGDTAVSSGFGRRRSEKACGARILRETWPQRTLRNRPNSGGRGCRGSGLGALDSPPGPHSPIGRGSGLKIRPVSVRVRLGARVFGLLDAAAWCVPRPGDPLSASPFVQILAETRCGVAERVFLGVRVHRHRVHRHPEGRASVSQPRTASSLRGWPKSTGNDRPSTGGAGG
jgi:hypothetical protein